MASLAEYAIAKAAGETLCRFIAAVDRQTSVKISRLPRLPTDQTLSISDQAPADDPVAVMRGVLEG